jgi:iron complex transport system substrate-binding protein
MSFPRSIASRVLATIAVGALALTAGCSSGDDGSGDGGSASETRSFKANNGTVEIPAEPERVVSLARATPPLVVADAPLVATTPVSPQEKDLLPGKELSKKIDSLDVIESGSAKTNAGGGTEIDYEAIAAAEPDLIISGFPAPVEGDIDEERLQEIAPTVFVGPKVPSEWREVGEKAADAAGVADNFGTLKDDYEKKAAELKKKYADKTEGATFAAATLFDSTEQGSYNREYSGSFITNIPEDVGIEFPGGGDEFSQFVSLENISDLDEADAILVSINPDGSIRDPRFKKEVMSTEAWKQLPAVKKGNVLEVPYLMSTTYAGAIEALDALDKQLEGLDVE